MNKDEARSAARLAGTVLRGTTDRIHDMHSGVAGRAFAGVGVPGRPIAAVHEKISGLTYRGVGAALSAGASALGDVAAQGCNGEPLNETPRGRTALSVLNGMYGDLVVRDATALAIDMSVCQAGRSVPTTASSLRDAFPEATGRIVVFLHGLTENEDSWGFRSVHHHGEAGVTYGDLLHDQLGYTPVYLRYNTGLHISDNGRFLAELLDQLADAWPKRMQDLVLIGHSMGGLVARSALHHAAGGTDQAWPWTSLVRDTITLGTPHLGAPLERGAHALTHSLARLPETRPLAKLLALRSVGIKDLRRGTLVSSDWEDRDLDAREALEHTHVPLHEGARHFVVLATLASDPSTRAGELFGDLLVTPSSATGDSGDDQRLAFEPDHVHRLGRLHHFDLLNHPKVYRQIRTWLEDRPEGVAPSAPAPEQSPAFTASRRGRR
jgi:pimeloyl-ACP methyl ester carboxylesterase